MEEGKERREEKSKIRKSSGKNNNNYYYWNLKEELINEVGKISKKVDPKGKEKENETEKIKKSENYFHDQIWLTILERENEAIIT